MGKVITVDEGLTHLAKHKQKIVLTGGCFDILHKGHIRYLSEAKKQGDILVVLLESDEAIRRLKGSSRPIHTQQDRAFILSHLIPVDYIVLLSGTLTNADYDELIFSLKPDIIATTKGDPLLERKKQQAERVNATVREVVTYISNTSTSRLAALLENEL